MLNRLFLLALFVVCTLSAFGPNSADPPARGYVVESDGSILVGSSQGEPAPICFLGCP